MARLDVPTLQCDRCKHTTQDQMEMISFQKIEHPDNMGNKTQKWDVCKSCWLKFIKSFMAPPITYADMYDGIKTALINDVEFLEGALKTGIRDADRITYVATTKAMEIISEERSW